MPSNNIAKNAVAPIIETRLPSRPSAGQPPNDFDCTHWKLGKSSLAEGAAQFPGVVLKRFLFIFNDRIFDSNVDLGIPSLAAAPLGPDTRPRVSFNAASIM